MYICILDILDSSTVTECAMGLSVHLQEEDRLKTRIMQTSTFREEYVIFQVGLSLSDPPGNSDASLPVSLSGRELNVWSLL